MDTPSLRQLDIFAQLVASGSVARCARDLGLSVEAVERDMAALERRLGYRLFEQRSTGGEAMLTDAGHKTARAMTLLSQGGPEWDAAASPRDEPIEDQAADDRAGNATAIPAAPSRNPITTRAPIDMRQQVTIAAPAPVFSHFQDALTAFEQSSGDVVIALDLSVQIAADAGRAMALGAADITYFYALGAPETFASRYVWSEQLIVYLGGDHDLAARDVVHLSDLAALAPVTMEPRSGVRAIVEQALAKAGLPPRAPALESDNLFDIMTAVRECAGYFAGFGPLARDFGRMPGIRRVPLAVPLPTIEVRQAVRAAMADDPMVSALAEYLCR